MDLLPRCECVKSKDYRETPDCHCAKCYGYGITPEGVQTIDPSVPCVYVAGSLEKVAWLMLRRNIGVTLWHVCDNSMQKKKVGGIPKKRYGIADEHKVGELTHDQERRFAASEGSSNPRN